MISYDEAIQFRGPLGKWKKICSLIICAIALICLATFLLAEQLKTQLESTTDEKFRLSARSYGANQVKDQKHKRVEEIIERAAEAMGGPRRYKDLIGTVQKSRIRISVSGSEVVGKRDITTQFRPYRFKLEQKLLGLETIMGFDGEEGWLLQNGERHALPPSMVKSIKGEMERSLFLMNYKNLDYHGEYRGIHKLQDRHDTHEIFIQGPSGSEMTVFIDKEIYYLRGYRFQDSSARGDVAVFLDDYTKLGDYAFPLRVSVYLKGEKTEELLIDHIDINPKLDEGNFAPPNPEARHQ